MSKEFPPYVNATGLIQELFKKIQEAPPPARFSQDFLFTNLKFIKSGSTVPFIPFLKRMGFISNDGTPTEIYKQFRNPNPKISGAAMAKAFKIGYADLYSRNEYWHSLSKEDLKNFLVEKLEVDAKNGALLKLLTTVDALKKYADFSDSNFDDEKYQSAVKNEEITDFNQKNSSAENQLNEGINLSYTINLNLPETSDIAVFDAIFKSLKEHLLRK